MLWQGWKDSCSCSYRSNCHCGIWRPVQNEAAVGPSGWQLLFTNTQYLSDRWKWQILPLCHHCGCSEPKQCWKPVPEERGSLSWQRQMCCSCRGGLLEIDSDDVRGVMHRRGVRGKEKKKNLEMKDGDERFLTDCFPFQAMSSSCFALCYCNPFFCLCMFLVIPSNV